MYTVHIRVTYNGNRENTQVFSIKRKPEGAYILQQMESHWTNQIFYIRWKFGNTERKQH